MADFFESVGKGLRTVPLASALGEGYLRRAEDGEYAPEDPGIRVAPARKRCGVSLPLRGPIAGFASLTWDPGTGEEKELIYVDPRSPGDISIVYPRDADNAGWDNPTVITNAALPVAFESGIETVAFDNNYLLLPGDGPNLWLERLDGVESYERHGLPSCDVDITLTLQSGSGTIGYGFYLYWFTLYDLARDIEGDRAAVSYKMPRFTMTWPPSWIWSNGIRVQTDSASSEIKLQVDGAALAALLDLAPEVQYIRVYRSKSFDNDLVGTQIIPPGNPWPTGILVGEVATSSFVYNAATGLTTIFTDSFSIDDSLLDRMGKATKFFETASTGGLTLGKRGAPPQATTGDVVERCLVLNDVTDPRKIRYSYPNDPHAFPTTFFLNIDTKDSDEVVALRTLGSRTFVGMKEGIWRLNWLPFDTDEDFMRGRVTEIVCEGKGVVGRFAATRATLPGFGPVVVWVARDGIYATDLDNVVKLTAGLDWAPYRAALGSQTRIIDNADKERLEVAVYTGIRRTVPGAPVGVPDAWLYLHYSGGDLRITGPVTRPGGIYCAGLVRRADRSFIVSTDKDGAFAIEGDGTVEDATGDVPKLVMETREIYTEGMGREAVVKRGLVLADGAGEATATFRLLGKFVPREKTWTDPVPGLDPLLSRNVVKSGERVQVRVEATGSVRVTAVGAIDDEIGEVER